MKIVYEKNCKKKNIVFSFLASLSTKQNKQHPFKYKYKMTISVKSASNAREEVSHNKTYKTIIKIIEKYK